MADLVLLRKRNLGQRAHHAFGNEDRVVAESSLPRRLLRDAAVESARRDEEVAGRENERSDSDESRLPIRDAAQSFQEQGVVPRIVDRFAGESGRTDSRGAAERRHVKPGVFRQDRKSGLAADRARLQERVLEERFTGLFDVGERAFGDGQELDAAHTSQEFAELYQLALVLGPEKQSIRHPKGEVGRSLSARRQETTRPGSISRGRGSSSPHSASAYSHAARYRQPVAPASGPALRTLVSFREGSGLSSHGIEATSFSLCGWRKRMKRSGVGASSIRRPRCITAIRSVVARSMRRADRPRADVVLPRPLAPASP